MREEMLREQAAHGNAMFPFMVHEIESDPGIRERVGCHWHEEMELLAITDGAAEVNIDGKSYAARRGDIFIILPDCLHSVSGEPGVPFSFFAVDFALAFLYSFVSDGIQQKYIDVVTGGTVVFPARLAGEQDWEREAARILMKLRSVFAEKEPAYELLIKAGLYELWHLLLTHAGAAEPGAAGSADYRIGLARGVMEYIRRHYDRVVSLEELSKEFGVSRGHLCRLFKRITGMTIVEYINYYRISMGVSYLRTTDREIGEIAGMTGFGNISYFNRVFRSYMHMTPGEFRQETLTQQESLMRAYGVGSPALSGRPGGQKESEMHG